MQNPQRDIDGILRTILNTQDPNAQKETMIRCFTQDVALRSFFCNIEPHMQSREDALGVYQWLRIVSPNTEFDTTNIAFDENMQTLIVEGKILFRFRLYPVPSKPANFVVVMKLKKKERTYQIASHEYYIHPDQFINIAFSPLTPLIRLGFSSLAYTYAVGAKIAQVLGFWRINGATLRNGNRTDSISSHSSEETRFSAENNYSGSERGGERQNTSKRSHSLRTAPPRPQSTPTIESQEATLCYDDLSCHCQVMRESKKIESNGDASSTVNMSSSQTSADSGSSNFLMDDRFERGIGNSSATSESPNSIDTINRQIPETLLSTALITPENAFTHASNRRGDIEQLLEDGGYNGHFSIHAGFNRRSIELQRDYQEIIIALSHAISDDLCASLEKAVQPFTCHILALPGSPVAEGFNEERSFPTRGCAQQPGGGGSASGYKGRSEGRSATRRSRDGGSGGGGGRSNDSESDDNDNDKRGKGGDRRGGGSKGHGDDDPGIHSGGIKRVGEGIFIVGIDSKLEFADGKQDLCILSKVKARIAEKGCHDDDWPGQILEVDVEPLQLKFKTFMDYKVGLGQVQISAPSVSQMAILNNHPHTISHEECVPREGRITKGFALSLSPSSSPAKATFSAQSEKKVEIFFNPWAVTSQSPRQIDDQDMVGQAWNYLPNPDKSFSDDDLRELTPGPTLRYGLTRPFVYPVLRVDLNVLWSLPRDNFKGIFRPAYLDLIHAVTLTVDLSKVPGPKDFNFGAGSKVFDKLAKAISDKGCHYLPEHTLPSTSTKAKCTLVQAIEGVTNGIGRKLKLEPKEEASKGLLLNAMKRRVPPQSLATPTVGDYTFDPAVDMPPGLP